MKLLRTLSAAHSRMLLAFVLAALGMQALVPAELMVAPAAGQGAAIILCPQSHPLARAAAARATAEMAAMHAAMGHGPADHAAMGHGPPPDDDAAPAASTLQSCAFAGAGALAGLLPDHPLADPLAASTFAAPDTPLRALQITAADHLRPPLRAPPAMI